MKKLIFGIFMSLVFFGCANEQSTLKPNKTQNSSDKFVEVPITLFGQEIKGYALLDEFKYISKRCDSDTSSSSYTQNVDAGYLVFSDGKELSCDIMLPNKTFIYNFIMLSDYAKEYVEQNNNNGFFSFLGILDNSKKTKKDK